MLDHTACFFKNERAAYIVWMGTKIFFDIQDTKGDRSYVSDETIMPTQNLIELSACGDVLIIEYKWRAVVGFSVERVP